jgi:hypothetical protein
MAMPQTTGAAAAISFVARNFLAPIPPSLPAAREKPPAPPPAATETTKSPAVTATAEEEVAVEDPNNVHETPADFDDFDDVPVVTTADNAPVA